MDVACKLCGKPIVFDELRMQDVAGGFVQVVDERIVYCRNCGAAHNPGCILTYRQPGPDVIAVGGTFDDCNGLLTGKCSGCSYEEDCYADDELDDWGI